MNRLIVVVMCALVGCTHPGGPSPSTDNESLTVTAFEAVRDRPVLKKGILKIKLKAASEPLNFTGTVGGVMSIDRPHAARIDLIAPFIGHVASLVYAEPALSILMMAKGTQYYTDDTETMVSLTGGALTADDVIGLLMGDTPWDEYPLDGVGVDASGRWWGRVLSPSGYQMRLILSENGGLGGVDIMDGQEQLVFSVVYGPFITMAGWLGPSSVDLVIPQYALSATVTIRSVDVSPASLPEWTTALPTGFVRRDLLSITSALSADGVGSK